MNAVITRFGAAAQTYDAGALAQQMIATDLAELGNKLPAPESIIEHGCGTGFFSAELARLFPSAKLTACDPSPAMIATASAQDDYGVTWRNAAAENFVPDVPADLVASSSALHWCPSLTDAMTSIRRQVRDGGHLLLAVMTRGTLGELHELRRELFPEITPYAELPTSEDIRSACETAGFHIQNCSTDDYVTYHSDAAALLNSLHSQGITSGVYSQGKRHLTRSELKSLVRSYNERYVHHEGGVYATYRAIRFTAEAR